MPRNVSSSILPEALRADEEPPVAGDAEGLPVEVA